MSSTAIIDPPHPSSPGAGVARAEDPAHGAWIWLAVALITVGAGVLRLIHVGSVPDDPFYDAAVRSMGLSWHNFFFGAFEPAGSVSIDKPPVDLWLQVVSVKLLGFDSASLKVPEALAGTLSVPLLFALVRRLFGNRAALAAALAMAVLPIEVLTSRSDTMDALMMVLVVLALWCLVRAGEAGATRWVLLAAVALGVAFNVKLLESVIPLPGLFVFAYLALPGTRRRRLAQLGAGALLYVAVALSWLTATLLFPAHDRPWAIGSTNGSAWNAAFVFNGADRVSGGSPAQSSFTRFHLRPTATQVQRDHISITAPSATRLLARVGPLSGQRLGLEVLVALLLGGPALVLVLLRGRRLAQLTLRRGPPAGSRRSRRPAHGDDGAPEAPPSSGTAGERAAGGPRADLVRRQRAAAAGMLVWLVLGIILFSQMQRLHPRYVEAFTPAVAAVFGIGVAWASVPRGVLRLTMLAITMAAMVIYGESVLYGTIAIWWTTALFALLTLIVAVVSWLSPAAAHSREDPADTAMGRPDDAFRPAPGTRRRLAPLGALTLVLALVATLAIPLRSSILGIQEKVTDAGNVGAMPTDQLRLISNYLRSHQGSARYEAASASATAAGALIVKDARPVLMLTTYNGRTLTSTARLRALIAAGTVRYAFINTICGPHTASTDAACSPPALWIRDHAVDVSRDAGLKRGKELWRLPRSIA